MRGNFACFFAVYGFFKSNNSVISLLIPSELKKIYITDKFFNLNGDSFQDYSTYQDFENLLSVSYIYK